ncbi:MAG: preprotein translocase subunit SecY [bacterium]|nr:preprotein translocase subunit SecY [bacterium]MDZ4295980.1 preprotein translocase subunit SecY [Patescibacteria group bacterium]
MLNKILRIFTIPELRKKLLFVLAILAVFRVAAIIPIPGIDPERLEAFFRGNQLFGLLNIFSGGALDNLSIVMLGVGPYITASIIFQLITMISPRMKELYEESEASRRQFNQYTRYLMIPLAALQGYGLLVLFQNQEIIARLTFEGFATNILIITAGTTLLVWLGELISERGIGNGISMLIFAGIIAGLPQAIRQAYFSYTPDQLPLYVAFAAITAVVIAGIVYINEAERPIPITYAKRVRGNRVYGGVSTYLPLRVNQAGVIPIIFALSLLLFPSTIATFLGQVDIAGLQRVAGWLSSAFNNQLLYGILYFVLVVLFTYFYTAMTFDPKRISENIQKQGGFVPGIRPGGPTATFFSFVINRITLAGAVFLGLIAILPNILQGSTGNTAVTIGGTSILIVVAVILETKKQVEAQLSLYEY